MTDRRGFVRGAVVGLLFVPWPVRAQMAPKVRRVGFLSVGARPSSEAELHEGDEELRQLGWVEGKNVVVERRYTNGRERLPAAAEELVRLNVDLIVTEGTDAALAAKNATTTIPIVMAAVGDPVAAGIVASLARPGGNITGYSMVSTEVMPKRAALLHELLPSAGRVAVMIVPKEFSRLIELMRNQAEAAYGSLGLQPIFVEFSPARGFEAGLAEAVRERAQALDIPVWFPGPDPSTMMQAAIRYRLPTMVGQRNLLEAGGLIYFAHNSDDQARRVAVIIDKVLRGAKPADTPIEQPTRFELGINLKTAKALGLTVPQSLLLRADEVIQ